MKLTPLQHRVYNFFISALAGVAAVLVLVDFSGHLNGWQQMLSRTLYVLFLVDFVVRFWKSRNKESFMKKNYTDLIAVLPFHGVFPAVRGLRLNRLLRGLNLVRLFAFLSRPLKKAGRFLNTNGFKYVLFVSTVIVATGGVLIHFAEGMSYGDGIWWAFVTATTVGYGDLSPSSIYGRIIAAVLMLLGIGLLGSVTSTLTSYFLKEARSTVREQAVAFVQQQLDDFDDLTEEDVEQLCALLQSAKRTQLLRLAGEAGRRNVHR